MKGESSANNRPILVSKTTSIAYLLLWIELASRPVLWHGFLQDFDSRPFDILDNKDPISDSLSHNHNFIFIDGEIYR